MSLLLIVLLIAVTAAVMCREWLGVGSFPDVALGFVMGVIVIELLRKEEGDGREDGD